MRKLFLFLLIATPVFADPLMPNPVTERGLDHPHAEAVHFMVGRVDILTLRKSGEIVPNTKYSQSLVAQVFIRTVKLWWPKMCEPRKGLKRRRAKK